MTGRRLGDTDLWERGPCDTHKQDQRHKHKPRVPWVAYGNVDRIPP